MDDRPSGCGWISRHGRRDRITASFRAGSASRVGAHIAYRPFTAPWAEYFATAQALMLENPPPATDAAVLGRIGPLGLARGAGSTQHAFRPAMSPR
jgi:hypothetical protein